MQIRVYYEDTDVGGVVYHSNYLNFCERARSELFFERGMMPLTEHGHFVASHLEADFKASARFGDTLHVRTSLREMRAASIVLLQEVLKEKELLFSMTITLAYLSHGGRPQRLHPEIKALFQSLKGENLE